MNQQVKRLAARASAAFGALGLGAALTVVSLLAPNISQVDAFTASGGQVQSRAIYMGKSTPSATTNYLVTWKPAATTAIKGIIVDFCDGASSPIVGDTTCTQPSGMSLGTPTIALNNTTTAGGNPLNSTALPNGGGTWTASTRNSGRTLALDNSTGSGSLVTATTYNFEVTGVTNPNTTGTFYARILTYSDDTAGTSDFVNYAPGTEGTSTLVDYGGFALSTATLINITAKVQETLTFCTSGPDISGPTADPIDGTVLGTTCGSATTPNLTIGHGSPVAVIDNSAVDRADAFMQISTNASTGAVVRMHAGNACSNGGLSTDGGTTCAAIPGVGTVNTSNLAASAITAGTPAFGLFVGSGYTTTGVATSTGTINASAAYHNGSHVDEVTPDLWYGMDSTATSGITGTYGNVIADTNSLPCNTMNSHLVFGATAGLTTPAGIYTGSESLIATGTF